MTPQSAEQRIQKLLRKAHVAGEFQKLQKEEAFLQEARRISRDLWSVDVGRIYRMSPGPEF